MQVVERALATLRALAPHTAGLSLADPTGRTIHSTGFGEVSRNW